MKSVRFANLLAVVCLLENEGYTNKYIGPKSAEF